MITNVAQLVSQLIDRERDVLAKHAIRHGPTIGRMYEGLTKKAVELTIPAEAKLIVAGGFIRGTGAALSDEQDVVIAFGDHEPIPHTDSYIFDSKRTIAAIEVKKTLGASSLGDALSNLNSILQLERDLVLSPDSVCGQFQDTIRRLMTDLNDAHQLAGQYAAVFRQILQRRTLPLRIVLGYEGYSTEYGLRNGVSALIRDAMNQRPVSPIELPDAILSLGGSVIATPARPWTAPIEDDGRWPFLTSNGYLPAAIILLEMLWTRFSDYGFVELAAFGDDLEIEPWNRFMDLQYSTDPPGWMFNEIVMRKSSPSLTEPVVSEEWRPAILSNGAAVLMTYLGREPLMSLDDFGADAADVERALRELEEAGLVGRHVLDPTRFGLLTRKLISVIARDGNTYAGENVSGRLVRWLVKHELLPSNDGGPIEAMVAKRTAEGIQGVRQQLPVNGIGWTELIAKITTPIAARDPEGTSRS